MLNEMNLEFTNDEQRIFVNNFYAYLNYNRTDDCIVDLDKIYEQLGFSRKDPSKRILEKNFTEGNDYKIVSHPIVGNSIGRPNEQIMLNVDTFKNLCMLAQTDKAKQIRKYYIKLEKVVDKIIKSIVY